MTPSARRIAKKAFVLSSCPIAGPMLSFSKISGTFFGKDFVKAVSAFDEELNALLIRISLPSPTR